MEVNITTLQSIGGSESVTDQISVVIPINGGSTEALENYNNSESIQISNATSLGTGLGNGTVGGGLSPTGSVDQLLQRIQDCLIKAGADIDPSDFQSFQMIQNVILDALNLGPEGDILTPSASDPINLFGMSLHYFDGNPELNAPNQFNGNISWIEWANYKEPVQRYGYQYDGANRLLGAQYEAEKIESCEKILQGAFDVTINGYDPRGNIMGITRNGLTSLEDQNATFGPIDNLTFNYTSPSSNLLSNIVEAVNDVDFGMLSSSQYNYSNGNMITDSGKGLTTQYNHLDLPMKMSVGNDKIETVYDASGRKLRQRTTQEGDAVDYFYMDGIEVKNGRLEAVYHDEGRIVHDLENSRVYNEYYLKDHLGNVRVRFADKDNNGILDIDPLEVEDLGNSGETSSHIEYQEYLGSNSYYPFGMKFSHNLVFGEEDFYWVDYQGEIDNKYNYNGKEEVGTGLGINLSDYGARYYDAAIARWTSVDPLAEEYSNQSAYNYVLNNPMIYIDPDGMQVDWIFDQQEDGSYKRREGVENDGGEENHTFHTNDGKTHFYNVKNESVVTVDHSERAAAQKARQESGGFIGWLAGLFGDGPQQQNSGDGFAITAKGSLTGSDIKAPSADPNGSVEPLDISDIQISASIKSSFMKKVAGASSLLNSEYQLLEASDKMKKGLDRINARPKTDTIYNGPNDFGGGTVVIEKPKK